MAGALLYFPHATQLDASLRACGLESLLDNSPGLESVEILQHGPDEADGGAGRGLLVRLLAGGHAGRLAALAYRKESQTWYRAPADPTRSPPLPAGRYYLGWIAGAPPGPGELARPAQYESIEAPLDDGHRWRIPIARSVPQRISHDPETGELRRQAAPEWQEYVDTAEALMAVVVHGWEEQGPKALSWKAGYEHAVQGLCHNYLLTRELVNALSLITTAETLFAAAGASWEFQRWREYADALAQKKTAGG